MTDPGIIRVSVRAGSLKVRAALGVNGGLTVHDSGLNRLVKEAIGYIWHRGIGTFR